MLRVAAILLALMVSSRAEETGIVVYNLGRSSCGELVLALNANTHNTGMSYRGQMWFSKASAFAEWISGYITAQNAARPVRQQLNLDMAGMSLWLKKYCEQNPTMSMMFAIDALLRAHNVEPMTYFPATRN